MLPTWCKCLRRSSCFVASPVFFGAITKPLCSRLLCSGPLCSGPLCSRPLWSGPLCCRPLCSGPLCSACPAAARRGGRAPHSSISDDPGRTRACNLWFRRLTPYPLGRRPLNCFLGHDDSNDDDDDDADSEPAISEEGGRCRQAAFIVAAPRPCFISCLPGTRRRRLQTPVLLTLVLQNPVVAAPARWRRLHFLATVSQLRAASGYANSLEAVDTKGCSGN